MNFYWIAVLLFSAGFTFRKSNGLKCYICNSGMDGCQPLKAPKSSEYLKDCAATAVACAAFIVETADFAQPFERWFQRVCLYPSDLYNFILENVDLNMTKPEDQEPKRYNAEEDTRRGFEFAHQVSTVNNKRKGQSLPEMAELPASSTLREWPLVSAQTCQWDGCNEWALLAIFPYAEGFPVEEYNKKKIDSSDCLKCNTLGGNTGYKSYCRAGPDQNEGQYQARTHKAYGCATHYLYHIVGGMEPYLERAPWFPGDSWCIQKKYDNARSQSSLVTYRQSGTSCNQRLARAVKERNDKNTVTWTGQRDFYSVQEFKEFLTCKKQVRLRFDLRAYVEGIDYVLQNFNEAAALKEYSGKTGPFASVGFHLCSPKKYCNEISDEKLEEAAKEKATTTTQATTKKPTTKKGTSTGGSGGGGDVPDKGCEGGEDEDNGATMSRNLFHGGIFYILVALSASLAV